MPNESILDGVKLLTLVGDVYEDLELWYPKIRMTEAGAEVVVAGAETDVVYKGKHGYPCRADVRITAVSHTDFNGIIIPGGFMPDKLRRDKRVLDCVKGFAERRALVAAICHGGWIPISAGVYKDVRVTGSLGIKDDLENAGAVWEDAPAVVDRHFVSSRSPDDLPEFCRAILEVLTA